MQRLASIAASIGMIVLLLVEVPEARAQCNCPGGSVEVDVNSVAQLTTAIATANANPGNAYCIKLQAGDYALPAGGSPGTAFLISGQVTLVGCGLSPAVTTLSGPFADSIECDPALNGAAAAAIVANINQYRLFRVVGSGVFAVENLTLRRGAALRTEGAVANGGAIWVQTGASLTAVRCRFEENVALTDGGAIYAEGPGNQATLGIVDCEFFGNVALRQGGGVFAQRDVSVLGGRFDCNFAGRPDNSPDLNPNESFANGGGLYSDQADVTIDANPFSNAQTVFLQNRARNGGAVFLSAAGTRKVYQAEFQRNHARLNGGAMFGQNLDILFVGYSNFGGSLSADGNTSVAAGGAVYFQNFNKSNAPLVLGCRFENNSTAGNGGAAAHDSAVAGFYDHCFFSSNRASIDGGAVDARGASRPAFNDCVFNNNVAGSVAGGTNGRGGAMSFVDGRAVLAEDADSLLYNCQFSRNRVEGANGGIGALGSTLYIDNSAPWLMHCSIAYAASGQAGVYFAPPGSISPDLPRPRIDNSIVYPRIRPGETTPTELAFASSSGSLSYARVRHSDVRGLAGFGTLDVNENNIDCDPLFVLSLGGLNNTDDVHLQECSPCIDRARQDHTNAAFDPATPTSLRTFGNTFPRVSALIGPEDSDYDDLNSDLSGFVEGTFEADLPSLVSSYTDLLTNPLPYLAPRITTPRPVACESDMGADEFERELDDILSLYCDPMGDGEDLVFVTSATACDPLGQGEAACGPFCEGEALCLTGVFEGLCPTGVTYQWYFQDAPTNDPAQCGPLVVGFEPLVDDGRITGSSTANLCFSQLVRCDSGCYRLRITRPTCMAPADFLCFEVPLRGTASPVFVCEDFIEVEVCIEVYQAPEILVDPLPATVCLGGTQQLCARIEVPAGCEPQCIWYKVVGTPDDVNAPMFPVDDILVCPLQMPLAGITCSDNSVGGGIYDCCLTFAPAMYDHAGSYYVVVTCGSLECSAQSDPAELRVIDPQPQVNDAAVCVGGQQCLEQVAILPELTPGSTYKYQWYRRPEADCLVNSCPQEDCSGGTPLTNSGGYSGVDTPILCINPAVIGHRGCYYVVVSIDGPDVDDLPDEGKCFSASDCACLTVVDPQPTLADRTVCLGGVQNLTLTTSLPPLPPMYSYQYQWFFTGTADCQPAGCGMARPCATGTAVADGARPSGTIISGATTATLTLSNVQSAERGCYYVRVRIDGPEGDAIDLGKCERFSNCACLTVVNPLPQVLSAAVCTGGRQCLEVSSLPTLPAGYMYTYQWYRVLPGANCLANPCPMGACSGGTILTNSGGFSGVNTPTLCIDPAEASHQGCYYVEVGIDSPDEGSAPDIAKCVRISTCACLTVVNPQPLIEDRGVCRGGTQTLAIIGTLPQLPMGYVYEYQWFLKPGSGSCPTSGCTNCPTAAGGDTLLANGVRPSGTVIAGANSASLTLSNTQPAEQGCYYVRVTINGPESPQIDLEKCLRFSNCACLTVSDPMPMVANRAVCLGGIQTFTVSPSLPLPPTGYTYTYRWFYLGQSNCLNAPCLPGQPCTGGTLVSNGARPSGASASGATTSTLTISNAQLADGGCYYVQVGLDSNDPDSNPDAGKCLVNSNCACLTVVDPQPVVEDAVVCVGGDQMLMVNSGSFPALPTGYTYTFRWWFRGTSDCAVAACPMGMCSGGSELMNVAPYSGVTTNTLMISGAMQMHQGCYYVVVGLDGTDAGDLPDAGKCAKASNCACLDVIDPPVITMHPEDAAVCEGDDNAQRLTVIVTYNGDPDDLCYQWYKLIGPGPCPMNPTAANGTPVTNGNGISGANTDELVFDPAVASHAGYYFLCVRVCESEGDPVNTAKCPPVYSSCARLDVLPPIVPCVLTCASGELNADGKCLFCDRTQITLCCNVLNTTQPLCYQWQFQANDPLDPNNPDPDLWMDIPGANGQCFEFEFNAPNIGMPCGPGCYRVKINYAVLSGPNCESDPAEKCEPVFSDPICIAETVECCPQECECKDNLDPNQNFYSLWRTGMWDGINGEWSFDRSASDGVVIKAADDFFLDQSSMHHIQRFLGEMLVRRQNLLIEATAKLQFFADCNGVPGELIAEFESEPCPALLGTTPDDFYHYQFWFDLREECFWLRGGIYWVSLVGVAPPDDSLYEAFWVTAGLPSQTPERPECGQEPMGACCIASACTIETRDVCVNAGGTWFQGASCTASTCGGSPSTILGKRPQFMDGLNDWAEYDPCCHPCDDFVFCLSGTTCPIMWDNGKPFLAGADDLVPPGPPYQVFGTRSEKSTLTVRNSRAADQFVVKTCNEEDVCYLEGYLFTNCIGFEVHLEIYDNDCREPQFELPAASPVYYSAIADPDNVIDLGYTGLSVGTTPVRAYKVVFCAFDPGLTLLPGRNYWVSLSVRDSFSINERAFFAHIRRPCDPCDEVVWKIDPGMELAPGRQITEWQSAGSDFAFMIATKKQPGTLPIGGDPADETCAVDLNSNNAVDVQDIFIFLSAWFAGCP